jgi:hypothetical protein
VQIRRTVQAPLTNVLMNGYAHIGRQKPTTPLFFNGCYFAAVGEAEQRQAFVKGVVDMLPATRKTGGPRPRSTRTTVTTAGRGGHVDRFLPAAGAGRHEHRLLAQ